MDFIGVHQEKHNENRNEEYQAEKFFHRFFHGQKVKAIPTTNRSTQTTSIKSAMFLPELFPVRFELLPLLARLPRNIHLAGDAMLLLKKIGEDYSNHGKQIPPPPTQSDNEKDCVEDGDVGTHPHCPVFELTERTKDVH